MRHLEQVSRFPKNTPVEEKIFRHPCHGTRQGITDFGRVGYGGPCPPSGVHRYFFRVYALNRQLELKAGAGRKELESEMIGHIIAEGELMGKYGKK